MSLKVQHQNEVFSASVEEDDNTVFTGTSFKAEYLNSLKLVERLHRLLLEVIKAEIDRENMGDINAVQALLIFNIGAEEVTAGELRSRGYYMGSNVSYNLKKLVKSGFINQETSKTDKRSNRLTVTPKGQEVCDLVNNLYNRQLEMVSHTGVSNQEEITAMNAVLSRLERLWHDQIRFRM